MASEHTHLRHHPHPPKLYTDQLLHGRAKLLVRGRLGDVGRGCQVVEGGGRLVEGGGLVDGKNVVPMEYRKKLMKNKRIR